MNEMTNELTPLGEQMQWNVYRGGGLLGGFCVLPGGHRAAFTGVTRDSGSAANVRRHSAGTPAATSVYSSRHLGRVHRDVFRDDSRVVIAYEFQTAKELVTATFETLGGGPGQDLHLLNASEHMMDDLIFR